MELLKWNFIVFKFDSMEQLSPINFEKINK